MKFSHVVTHCAGLLFVAAVASAQQPATCPSTTDLDGLRTGRRSDSDNPVVDAWIKAAMQELQQGGANAATENTAAVKFIDCFTTLYTDKRNEVDFRAKIAERAASLFTAEFAKGKELPDYQAWGLSRVLLVLESDRTKDALLAGLSLPYQRARYTCAAALAAIKPQITVDTTKTKATLAAIAAAGKNEPSAAVAEAIYDALSYPPQEHGDDAARAIADMLAGRVALLRGKTGGNIGRAEAVAIRYLSPLMDGGKFPAAFKEELVRQLAPLLRLAVERFSIKGLNEAERFFLEETITEAESLLKKLVNPTKPVDVTGKMVAGGQAAANDMKIELLTWIGSESDEGLLNAAPWNVPRGAP